LALLLRDPPAADPEIRSAAQAAGWRLARSAAPLAVAEGDLARVGRRLSADALVATVRGVGCALVPGAAGPTRAAELERATRDVTAALGPTVRGAELGEAGSSASAGLRAIEAGAIAADGLLDAEQHLPELLLFESGGLAERLGERRLAPPGGLTPQRRAPRGGAG